MAKEREEVSGRHLLACSQCSRPSHRGERDRGPALWNLPDRRAVHRVFLPASLHLFPSLT